MQPDSVYTTSRYISSARKDVIPTRGSKRPAPEIAATASRLVITPDHPCSRADAPVVRHTRRGTTAAAVAALATFGAVALVEARLQDRYARSASSTAATLATTWEFYHDQAFSHERPQVPYLPITVRILVMVGSLFKAAGYRSYPNYVSAMRGPHS